MDDLLASGHEMGRRFYHNPLRDGKETVKRLSDARATTKSAQRFADQDARRPQCPSPTRVKGAQQESRPRNP
jgi:hypothetical protein